MDEDEKIDEEKQRAQVDYVIVGGVTGIVRRINIRSTQVETFDTACAS